MSLRKLSHVVGFDDAPFERAHRGDVAVIGAVFAGTRFEGILSGRVRRDGANAAAVLARMVQASRFAEHLQLILLQGVALAGFNVVDVFRLNRQTGLPAMIVARVEPDYRAIRRALEQRVRGGGRKWRLIERLGPMEPCRGIWIQRVGLTRDEADAVIERLAVHSSIPEPLRVAHAIAGGLARGESRGRV